MLLLCLLFASCSKKADQPSISYSKVGIYKLEVLNLPATDPDGYYWDNALNGTYPDVYFNITVHSTNSSLYLLSVDNRIENLQSSALPASWSGNNGSSFLTLNNVNQAIDVNFYDYDYLTTDQYMGGVSFNFADYTSGGNKYPTDVTVSLGNVSVKLYLTWSN